MLAQLDWERYWPKSRRMDQESSAMQVVVWQTPRKDIRRQRKRHWCSYGLAKSSIPMCMVCQLILLQITSRWKLSMAQGQNPAHALKDGCYECSHTNSRSSGIADHLSRLVGNLETSRSHSAEAEEYVRFVAINATPCAINTWEVEEASAIDEDA